MSRRDSDSGKVPAALYDRLTDTPTYAARMYKVQLRNLLNMCATIRIGVEDFLWSGDHPVFGQSYPPELIQ